jgi:chaperone required for assembly of F1-ATPase
MPLTRLANAIIDGVAKKPGPAAAEIEKYLGSDLLFYRAEEPEGLVAHQAQHWDPVLQWARDELGARFVLAQGVTFVDQPREAVAAAAKAVPADPWRLGAVGSATALTGSALLALALAHGRLGVEDAWTAAHVDEDWNMTKWGRDEQALERRAFRFTEMSAAAQVLSALRTPD